MVRSRQISGRILFLLFLICVASVMFVSPALLYAGWQETGTRAYVMWIIVAVLSAFAWLFFSATQSLNSRLQDALLPWSVVEGVLAVLLILWRLVADFRGAAS